MGTNSPDYAAACGLARLAVGEMSDGLARIENGAVLGAPRAFACTDRDFEWELRFGWDRRRPNPWA